MHDIRFPIAIISQIPVITAPGEIDAATADQLRAVLLETATGKHTTVVVDMTTTRFCDSTGLSVLVRAHKRALAEGGELRLVIPAHGAVYRVFTLTTLYHFVPRFDSLADALLQRPAAVIRTLDSGPASGLRSHEYQPGNPGADHELAAGDILAASVTAGESGPLITLSGETDLTSVPRLSALLAAHLAGGTLHLTIDISGLHYADSASIRALVLAARTLNQRGGSLTLLRPQPALARVLALWGAEQVFTIRGDIQDEPDP
jgi:anti-sigma B factor antagonist